MTLSSDSLRPSIQQKRKLGFAADERRGGSVASARKRLVSSRTAITCQAGTAEPIPFSASGSIGLRSNKLATSVRVLSAMMTPLREAAACKRAARLGVSPSTVCSDAPPTAIESPTRTTPLAMPIRHASSKSSTTRTVVRATMISSAARIARSASSSCACG